jgi:hypothetical protein
MAYHNDGTFTITDKYGDEHHVDYEQMMDDWELVCTNSGDSLARGGWHFDGENDEIIEASIMRCDPIFEGADLKGQMEAMEQHYRSEQGIMQLMAGNTAPNGGWEA